MIWRWSGARWWPSSGPAGRARARCCMCWVRWSDPSSGTVLLGGTPVVSLTDDALAALRNRTVGFVFQFHHLLREFSAVENVMMPLRIAGIGERRGPIARRGAADRVWACPVACIIGRQSCRAASSSVPRSPVPWPRGRRSCWRTNQAAISISGTPSGSTSCSRLWPRKWVSGSWWSRTTVAGRAGRQDHVPRRGHGW